MLWGLRTVSAQPAAGAAVSWLKGQIHAGLLLPGEKLPPERRLAEDLGISRVTLREALRTLEAEGYIGVRRGVQGGAFVADAAALAAMTARGMARDPAGLMRLHEMRALVEPGVARLAAARRDAPDLKRIDQAVAAVGAAADAAALRQGESLFRLALAEAAHNAHLLRMVRDGLCDAMLPYAPPPVEATRDAVAADAAALAAAVRRRDEDAAEDSARRLLARERALLRAALRG